MAFFGKAAGILEQAASVSRHIEMTASKPSIFQMIRSMSSSETASVSRRINNKRTASKPSIFQMLRSKPSTKLFIGGLSYTTDEPALRAVFSEFGEVIDARVTVDRKKSRSRGFGFVTYTSPEDASSALQALDGQNLRGRRVRVSYATVKPTALIKHLWDVLSY